MRSVIRSLLVSAWFMVLTFPIMCIRVDASVSPANVTWRLENALYMGIAIFVLSFVWRAMMARKGEITPEEAGVSWLFKLLENPRNREIAIGLLSFGICCLPLLVEAYSAKKFSAVGIGAWVVLGAGVLALLISLVGKRKETVTVLKNTTHSIMVSPAKKTSGMALVLLLLVALPLFSNMYQTTVLTQALIWVALGLGLNIVVGQTGLLVLGYMAFYAVGAYTYAILSQDFGLGFWALLPVGGILAAVAGLLIGFPVLRLKGDYLAIVTLGFGEIVNQVIKNWSDLTGGSKGISGIAKPSFFGMEISMTEGAMYVYYIALALAIVTIFAVGRLRDSRLGRSWMALREDEIACETMGIDKTKAKLTAFALGACWAGFGGVVFAAKNSLVNPVAFSFMESITILCVVVLGGLGSIWGVVLGAFIIVLLPEYLRAFSEYRMLIFGACLVLMMVFRPQGIIAPKRKEWKIPEACKTDSAQGIGEAKA